MSFTEVIVFPDAVAITINYLRGALAARSSSATVGSRVPDPRGEFVAIRRAGAERHSIVVELTTLSVECWGATQEAADDLARLTRGLLGAMQHTTQAGTVVYAVDDVPPGQFDEPDALSDDPRQTFEVQISLRGAAA